MDTLDWAAQLRESEVPPHQGFNHVNGNLIAAHESLDYEDLSRKRPSIREGPWEESVYKDWNTNFPEKILHAELDPGHTTIDLWNIRAIPGSMWGEEKIKILEDVYNRIEKAGERPRMLAGDLNSPKDELPDGTVIPWGLDRESDIRSRWIEAELNIMNGLEEIGMEDVFRSLNGYGDIELLDTSFERRRFDHLFASSLLGARECYYEPDGFEVSDYAPLIAEFDL